MTSPPKTLWTAVNPIPWNKRPWHRLSLWSLLCIPIAFGAMVISFACNISFHTLPSTTDAIRMGCISAMGISVLITAIACHRSNHQRAVQRGHGLAVTALLGVCANGFLLLGSMGPSAELAGYRLEYAMSPAHRIIDIDLGERPPDGQAPLLHIAELVASRRMDPRDLVNPYLGTEPLTLPPNVSAADWRSIVDEVDRHCDIIYLGPESPILCYDRTVKERDGRLVSHTQSRGPEFLSEAEFLKEFAAVNADRAAKGLPPFTLDVQPTLEVPKK